MTPEQITLVQASIGALQSDGERWSAAFYRHLFEERPDLRSIFPSDLTAQGAKFTTEIAMLLRLIGDLDTFEERAGQLGEDHVAYGVRPSHYRASAIAMIASIEDALGDEATPEVLDAWRAVHGLVAETMIAGALRHPIA